MGGGKINVSEIRINTPLLNIGDHCKLGSTDPMYKICRDYIDLWRSRYNDVVGKLRRVLEGSGDSANRYFEGRHIGHLEDICPEIRLGEAESQTAFMPENITETFNRLTACQQRLSAAEFLDHVEKCDRKAAWKIAGAWCLQTELKAQGAKGADTSVELPVGKGLKCCIEFRFPLHGESRFLYVIVPEGYTPYNPLASIEGIKWKFHKKDGAKNIFRTTYLNVGREDFRTLEVGILKNGGYSDDDDQETCEMLSIDLSVENVPERP